MVTLRFSWSEKSVDSKVSFPHLNFGKVQEVVEDAQQRHRRRFQESEIFLLFRGKGVSRTRSVMPMMPFIGVRILWLILDDGGIH
jgi:hypothetical protein